MAYFFPLEHLFEALTVYRDYARELMDRADAYGGNGTRPFAFNQPAEYRLITVDDQIGHLAPAGHGAAGSMFGVIEALNLQSDGLAYAHGDAWKEGFAELEARWLKVPGARPHTGKMFGFAKDEQGRMQPYSRSRLAGLYSEDVKAAFKAYARGVDPDGFFMGGDAAIFMSELRP
jgi:hypothetical protein